MKQICTKSGVEITTTHSLAQLATKAGIKRTLLGVHPAFSYSLKELTLLVSSTPADALTPTQRHILIVAALEALDCLEQYYPILPGTCGLTEQASLLLWPTLVKTLVAISTHATLWNSRRAVDAIPRLAVRRELLSEISIPAFFKEVLSPQVVSLEFGRAYGSARTPADDIAFERELQEVLWKRKDSKYLRYTPNVGKQVLLYLTQSLGLIGRAEEISGLRKALFQEVLAKEPAKLSHIPDAILYLFEKYLFECTISCEPEDTIMRSYIALTTSHLRSIREHRESIDILFGIITQRPAMPVNPALGEGSFTIKTPAPSPLATVTLAEPATTVPKAATGLAARILAKRAQTVVQEQAQDNRSAEV